MVYLTVRRLLLGLALLGLLLAPVAQPAIGIPMDMPGAASPVADVAEPAMAMSDDMPCCPDTQTAPDCGKACPLMALCFASILQYFPVGISLSAPLLPAGMVVPGNDADFATLAQGPPLKPPRI
jgi:hypothetical protein